MSILNTDTIKVQSVMDDSGVDVGNRKRLLSIALGLAVGRLLTLPGGVVESINEYYNNSVYNEANDIIYKFNEQLIVDTDLASETAKNVWLFRYKTAFPAIDNGIVVTPDYDVFCAINHVNMHIPLDVYQFANQHGVVVTTLVNAITAVLVSGNEI